MAQGGCFMHPLVLVLQYNAAFVAPMVYLEWNKVVVCEIENSDS